MVAISICLLALVSAALAAPSTLNIHGRDDAQSSLSLDPSQVQDGLFKTGQGATPDPGQVPSLTSHNNFINYCKTRPDLPLTNGLQILTGSCNPTPIGVVAAKTKMPISKFVFPKNGQTIPEGTFTIRMAIRNVETGHFVNPLTNYYAAPQQTNGDGIIIGHSHVVVQAIPALDSTEPLDAQVFAFFKGLNTPANGNGELTTDVTGGLPAGFYRMASMNAAANHQPVIVATAQHGYLDDAVYFEVKAGNGTAASSSSASSSKAATPTPKKAAVITSTSKTAKPTPEKAAENTAKATTTSAKAAATKAHGHHRHHRVHFGQSRN